MQDEAVVPARASSRYAARAASQSIRANLEEERIGAITRPKYPEAAPTAAAPDVKQEQASAEQEEDMGEATTIEHDVEEQDEMAPEPQIEPRPASTRQNKKPMHTSGANEPPAAETVEVQEDEKPSKRRAGSKTRRKGKGRSAKPEPEDSEHAVTTDEEGDKSIERAKIFSDSCFSRERK